MTDNKTPLEEAAIDYVNGDYWGADPNPPIRVRNPQEERYFKAGAEWLAKWLIAARQQHISEGGSFFSEFDVEDLIEQATGIKEN